MELLTLQQRIFIVKKYYQSNNSTEIVQNDFPNTFRKSGTSPTNEMILNLVAYFEKFGTIRRRLESKDKKVETKIENDEPKSPEPSIVSVQSDDEFILSVKQVIEV